MFRAQFFDTHRSLLKFENKLNRATAGRVWEQSEAEYDTTSHHDNLLVLVPRVVVQEDGILQPSGMPILTLAKTVNVANVVESMEVGLRYGQSYWKNELS